MIRRTAAEVAIRRTYPPRSSARRRVARSARRAGAVHERDAGHVEHELRAALADDPQQGLLQWGLRADVDLSADRHDGPAVTGADTQGHTHDPTLTAPAAGPHPRHGRFPLTELGMRSRRPGDDGATSWPEDRRRSRALGGLGRRGAASRADRPCRARRPGLSGPGVAAVFQGLPDAVGRLPVSRASLTRLASLGSLPRLRLARHAAPVPPLARLVRPAPSGPDRHRRPARGGRGLPEPSGPGDP